MKACTERGLASGIRLCPSPRLICLRERVLSIDLTLYRIHFIRMHPASYGALLHEQMCIHGDELAVNGRFTWRAFGLNDGASLLMRVSYWEQSAGCPI